MAPLEQHLSISVKILHIQKGKYFTSRCKNFLHQHANPPLLLCCFGLLLHPVSQRINVRHAQTSALDGEESFLF